jgi:hypothetical protein
MLPGHEVLSTPNDAPSADQCDASAAGGSLGAVVTTALSSDCAEDGADGRAEPQATSTVATTATPAARLMLDSITLLPHSHRTVPAQPRGTSHSSRSEPLDVDIDMATTLPLGHWGVPGR